MEAGLDATKSEKGSEALESMLNTRRRPKQDWQMNHYQTKFMTGHGNSKTGQICEDSTWWRRMTDAVA